LVLFLAIWHWVYLIVFRYFYVCVNTLFFYIILLSVLYKAASLLLASLCVTFQCPWEIEVTCRCSSLESSIIWFQSSLTVIFSVFVCPLLGDIAFLSMLDEFFTTLLRKGYKLSCVLNRAHADENLYRVAHINVYSWISRELYHRF